MSLKKFFIDSNNFKSFMCKVIIKQGAAVQPIEAVSDFIRLTVKLASASQNPVTHQGLSFSLILLINWVLDSPAALEFKLI